MQAMLGGRSWEDRIAQYSAAHQHPVNRLLHTLGIPMIALALLLAPALLVWPSWWVLPAGLFVAGWIFQFLGHAVEGKPPEFLRDYRFLFVGLRWWWTKVTVRSR